MTRLEERIRSNLHAAGRHLPDSPAPQPSGRGRLPGLRGRWRGPLVAAAAMAAVLVALGGVVLFRGLAPDPPVGTVEAVTLEEFEAGVMDAFGALFEAPGFQATQVKVFGTGEVEHTWLDYRPGPGERSDPASWVVFGVVEAGNDYRGAITVMVDGSYYTARYISPMTPADTIWSENDQPAPLLSVVPLQVVTAYPFDFFDEYAYFFGTVFDDFSAEATRQETAAGGTRWTVTYSPSPDITVTEHWHVHPDGHLEAHTFERTGPELRMGIDARHVGSQPATARIDFALLTDPAPHTPPEARTPVDPSEFGLPSDFPGQEGTAPPA